MRRLGDAAIALALTLAGVAAGSALYSHLRPVNTDARSGDPRPQWSSMQTEPVGEPLRVANPFDATEIFEFPAGTSEADARDAVAGFLLERATRRGAAGTRRQAAPKG